MKMLKLLCVFGILLLNKTESLKIGICVPDVSGSQVILFYRLDKKSIFTF